MRGIVLVGGEGTRLRPLTDTLPKQMLPVVEVPLIERVVGQLTSHGVTDAVLSLGYRPEAFIAGYPDSRCAGATLTYVAEAEPLDTAGAIRLAAKEAGITTTFLVLNGDVLTDIDISALVRFHRHHGGEGTIALTQVADPSNFGVVPVGDDGRVEAFIEKPAAGTAPTHLVNAGIYVLEPSVLDRIAGDRRVNIEREIFPAMVADRSLYASASEVYWLDVGTAERFLTANTDLLDGRRGLPAPGARQVSPGVWILGSPSLEGKVSGSLIADGARVSDAAMVDASVVGRGAVVGPGAVLTRSVLMAGARVEEGAEVADSVIGPGAIISPGARVRQASLVGAGATVGAGACHDGARLCA